jgi:hypothetical protein
VNDSLPLRISSFSNRGPLVELLAPGAMITSAGIRGGTSTFAGTSQAAPHVAAVAALLRQVDPRLSPFRVRDLLVRTGRSVADGSGGEEYPLLDAAAAVDAALESLSSEPSPFLRADCNPDGFIDISDPVTLLLHLFNGAVMPSCLASCDADGDGALNLSDAVFSLNYLCLGAAAPPAPFPECGVDLEGAAALGCLESACSSK